MDTVARQSRGGAMPGSKPVPGGAERLAAMEGVRKDVQRGSEASRSALRYTQDVLADLMQRDSKD